MPRLGGARRLFPALLAVSVCACAPEGARAQQPEVLFERGDYAAAARGFALLGRHALAGEAWLALGRWEEARAEFDRGAAGPDSLPARLGQARLLELSGRRAEARRAYESFIAAYNRGRDLRSAELAAVAAALERLSVTEPLLAREALRAWDEAIAADGANLDARLRAAELLLERYNGLEARDAYRAVLRLAPGNARALLGMARTARFLADGDPVAPAESALARNPNLVAARVFLAELHLERDDWVAAAREADAALAVNPRESSALAVRAALAWMRSDAVTFAAVDSALRALDPAAGAHLAAAAEAAARTRRYADAVALAERAVRRDSASWRGWALLGINLLRRGAMSEGRVALETAFRGDPFDLWTRNTLDMLDVLEGFAVTVSPHFRFVMDPRESGLLTLYFAPLAEEAWTTLARRYGFQPPAPVRVEVFRSHADFSVRTIGLAGIGALGVCFGPVVAMDSPSARDRGTFNWGSTLWHELAHVFHLERSNYRVPRWFTEGVAVLEERRARPGWGEAANPSFLRAFSEGSLPTFSRLNDGFLRPGSMEGIAHAYLLSSYAAEWLEETWGEAVLVRLLDAWGRGLDGPTVADTVLGVRLQELDGRFESWMRARFGARIAGLAELSGALRAGNEALRAGRPAAARTAFERARQLFPEYTGADGPHRALARIKAAAGDRAGAAAELEELLRLDGTAWDAATELASHLEALGRLEEAAAALERILFIAPFDAAVHQRLAAWYSGGGRHALAVRELRAVIALEPSDRAGAWYALASAQLAAGDRAAARRSVLRSLEFAPGYAEAQELLLRLQEGRP
jgi:tetratricopeptide (TPR) repeat protein